MPNGGVFNNQLAPWDSTGFNRTHYAPWVAPNLYDSQAQVNQVSVIHDDLYGGKPAWDYQNPQVWFSRSGLLGRTKFTLAARYPSADTEASVVANIARGLRLSK